MAAFVDRIAQHNDHSVDHAQRLRSQFRQAVNNGHANEGLSRSILDQIVAQKSLCNHHLTLATEVFEWMKSRKITIINKDVCQLLQIANKVSNAAEFVKIWNNTKDIKRNAYVLHELMVYELSKGHHQKAQEIFNKQLIHTDPKYQHMLNHSYRTLIKKLVHNGQYQQAFQVYETGNAKYLPIDASTINSLLYACCKERNKELVDNLWSRFIELNQADLKVFNSFIQFYGITQDEEGRNRVNRTMQLCYILPDEKIRASSWKAARKGFNKEISPALRSECNFFTKHAKKITFDPARIPSRAYSRIQNSRKEGSGTLASDPYSVTLWERTDAFVRQTLQDKFFKPSVEWICDINRNLGQSGGGNLRTWERVSSGGRIYTEYAPPSVVKEEVEKFIGWLRNSLSKCEKGEKNPIEVAAKSFQRLVSIHPFCDQNGRTSRMVMDYVLQKNKLPPAAIGKDVCLAFFSLANNEQTPETATRTVLEAVKRSYNIINA